MTAPPLLYLGFAFPPGVSALFPELQPAGHLIETCLVESLGPSFDVRSVGVSGLEIEQLNLAGVNSPGLPHALNLLDKAPEIYHRYRSLLRLKRAYREWTKAGWTPDIIIVCNLSPIYNAFILWLRRQPKPHPKLVLYLADSTMLGLEVPWKKRFRYRFKPLVYLEADMPPHFDACVAVSQSTRKLFSSRTMPWLWLPNGIDPRRVLPPGQNQRQGPIRFGYFGALAVHTGLPRLLELFTARERASELHICGYGKTKAEFAELCRNHPRLRFVPPCSPDECVQFAQTCDVMVNPRPIWPGNENNFSSKVFEYALAGRPILTSRLSGVDEILGPEAFYFDEHDFDKTLEAKLDELEHMPRADLYKRGAAVQERMVQNYSWAKQGERLRNFLEAQLR